jgi:type VI secretion system protein ImpB
MDGKAGAEELIRKVLNDPTLLRSLAAQPAPGQPQPEPTAKEE